jgi:hypothetical protein
MLDNIDWKLLREQKEVLLEVLDETAIQRHEDALCGILHLIDSIQDDAVRGGVCSPVDPVEVFGEEGA